MNSKKELSKKDIAPFLSDIADFFGGKVRGYVLKTVFGKHLIELEWILKNSSDNSRVLDIGGGLGINLLTLKKINKSIDAYLIDNLEEYEGNNSLENPMGSASMGRKFFKEFGINLVQEDFWQTKKLPFNSEFFDVVTCFEVIEHLPGHPLDLLREIKRVLKKDGTIIICSPNLLSTARKIRFLLGRHPYIFLDMWLNEKFDKYYGHYREYTRKEHQILLERAGFKQVKTFMVGEPTRTRAFNFNSYQRAYYHKQYKKFSLLAIGLWSMHFTMYLVEIMFPSLRALVYCTAKCVDNGKNDMK